MIQEAAMDSRGITYHHERNEPTKDEGDKEVDEALGILKLSITSYRKLAVDGSNMGLGIPVQETEETERENDKADERAAIQQPPIPPHIHTTTYSPSSGTYDSKLSTSAEENLEPFATSVLWKSLNYGQRNAPSYHLKALVPIKGLITAAG